ncbi:MAG: dockerin type I domain-containing protein, partial [Patescibacteria group bacterium]|nr:dockerin type I domain-containing protein [Patescibacteria group bacterium]
LKDNVLGTTNPSTYSLSRAQYLFNLWYVPQAPYYTTYHGEDSGLPPDTEAMIFPLKNWVQKEPAVQLRKYLDAPDALVGDYYYMQNLTRTIEASGTECWEDILTPAQKCTSVTYLASDINQDGKVDLADINLLFDNWNTPRDRRADINGDGIVNGVDFALVIKDWGT